ncbi:MAG: molybdopterin synthase sulfur carrier subunit [Candidatus Latescibacterota bacterium]|jgi:molybdopterin synthase sulfur carrier subunit
MEVTIKYFGLLAEVTNQNEETLVFSSTSISELLEALYIKYPALKEKDFQVAQNLEIVSKEASITATEIALLPPFSGG